MLAGLRIIESGASLSTAFAGRLLRSLGAEVLRLPDTSDALANNSGPVHRALTDYLHEGKHTLAVGDLHSALESADAWLDGRSPAEILADPLTVAHRSGQRLPNLTHVAVTPFGLDGPWRDKPGSALIASAVGGFLHLCGDTNDVPLRNGGHLVEFQTGLWAALAAVAGIFAVELGKPGRLVDLSLLESVISFQERGDIAVTHVGADLMRSRRHEGTHPFTILPCKDGYVSIATGTPRQWQNLAILIGHPEWADDPEFLTNRLAHWQEIDAVLLPWLAERTARDVTESCQEMLIAAGPVLTASQVLADAHLRERQFLQIATLGGAPRQVPGVPLMVDGVRVSPGAS